MRHLLFLPAFSLVLAAQAPVDYPALRQLVKSAITTVRADLDAQTKAGVAWGNLKRDLDKPLEAIRAQGANARGELKEACLLAELNVTVMFSMPEALTSRILKEIPTSSPAWQVVDPQVLGSLTRVFGPAGATYIRQMGANGPLEVRPVVLSGLAKTLLDEGKIVEAKPLVATLEKDFPGHALTNQASVRLRGELATAVGQEAPDFSVANLDDPKVTFTKSSFKGKYLLMDFWGTWCGYCLKELPNMHKVYAKYHARGLEILSLAADKAPEAVVAFRQKPGSGMPWQHAFIGRGEATHPVVKSYGIQHYPSLFLIGPEGKIVARDMELREDKLEQTLARLMK